MHVNHIIAFNRIFVETIVDDEVVFSLTPWASTVNIGASLKSTLTVKNPEHKNRFSLTTSSCHQYASSTSVSKAISVLKTENYTGDQAQCPITVHKNRL